MNRTPLLMFVLGVGLVVGPATGQDKTAALDKARTRFEAEIAKAEEALLATLDKALAKAGGNKQAAEKLKYERELFAAQRIPPTAVPAAAYLKQRAVAVAALEAAYLPVIRDLGKTGKAEEAAALDAALCELVKAARGYGLALPPLEARPPLVIEHKASGQLLDVEAKPGTDKLVLSPKAAKKKTSQVWYIEREERGVTIRNAATKEALTFDPRFGPEFQLRLTRLDPNKDTPDESLFKLTESGRQVAIIGRGRGDAPSALATSERKLKGVTVTDLVFDKVDDSPKSGQWWVISEAK